MHSRFRAVALSFTISLALTATSCIDVDKTLGVNNIPDDYALNLQTATLRLPLQTKMLDSMQSLSTSSALLGAFRTPEFGLTTHYFATNFYHYSTKSVDYGTDRRIKNIYMTLLKSSSSIMDGSQEGLPQTFHVYQMNRVIDTTYKYNCDLRESDYNHTPIDTNGVIYTGGDTLRIWLKNSFGQKLLGATQRELDSSSAFMERFKALLFTCDSPDEGTVGGRLNEFYTSSAYIYLTFNFQPTWQSARKDTTIMLVVGENTYTQNFSTYESKPLENPEPQEYITVEGLGGLKAYTDPLQLKDTLDRWISKNGYDPKKLVICKATFKLPFVTDNSTVENLNKYYPYSLYPNYKDKDTSNHYFYAPLEDIYSLSNYAGEVNRSLSCYMGDISSQIQKLCNKDRSEIASNWKKYAMWFSAVAETTTSNYYSSSSTTTFSIDRSTYSVGKLNGPLHADYPRVEIVFALLNDQ
ncbi:MAG: DUF4270 family protein [Bacteroidales bacterium]|nr:DUF4270 family protein [Bacteroidales bacterium]